MMDFESHMRCYWPAYWIGAIAITSIIWFAVHLVTSILNVEGKDEWEDMKIAYQVMMNIRDDNSQNMNITSKNNNKDYSSELATICQQIEISLSENLWTQLLQFSVLFIVFFLAVQIWFIPNLGGYSVSMIFGASIVPVLAFFAVKYTSKSLSETLISAAIGKEVAFASTFNSGFALTFLFVGVTIFFFLLSWFITTSMVADLSQDNLKQVSNMLFGYLMGLTLACFVYREGASLMARGIKTATFGLIKSETSLHLENLYISHMTKLAYMVQSQIGQILVNFLDTVLVLGLLCVSSVAILANSTEISAEVCHQKALLGPISIIILTFLGAVLVFFMKISFQDDEAAWFTAINIRWIMILQSIVSLFIIIIIPFYSFGTPFSLAGSETKNIDYEGINKFSLMKCLVLGLFTNILLISLYEWYTSHGCAPVRNLALSSVPRLLSMNLIFANYLGGLAGFVPSLIIAIMIYICMEIASYAGLLLFAAGYLSSIYVIMPIYFVGSATTDSYRLSCFANIYEEIQDTIHKMGAIILSLVVIGAILFQNGTPGEVFNGTGLSSLIVGLISANLIKGLNSRAVVQISKDYTSYLGNRQYQQIQQDERIYSFTYDKYMSSIISILINITLITLTIITLGVFLGIDSLVGYTLGFIIATAQIMFSGIIIGQVLENARIYNEAGSTVNKTENVYQAHVQGEIFGYATEETNGSPLLVYLVYVVALSYSGSTKVHGWGGLLAEYLTP